MTAANGAPGVLALFAGCGGLDRGLLDAIPNAEIYAYELDRAACDVYPLVTGCSRIEQADLTRIDYGTLPDCDGIVGGPPCVEFSQAGRKAGEAGARNLWPETIKIVKVKHPHWFVFENVPALTRGKNKPYFQAIIKEFQGMGYSVDWRILNAANYGVPQTRERVFITGRLDGQAWNWPTPTYFKHGAFGFRKWISWGEALQNWVNEGPEPGKLPEWILRKYRRPSLFDTTPTDGYFPNENMRKEKQHREIWEPACTVTAGLHHRLRAMVQSSVFNVDVKALAILQTLPYVVGLTKQCIGNAVPPLLARAIFAAARINL